jgi:predicted phosphodiesterase
MNKSEVVRQYIKDNKINDDFPSRTLARILMFEYPTLWANIDNCRATIKSIRGNNGNAMRNKVKDPEKLKLHRENRDPAKVGHEYNLNPIKIGFEDYIFKYKKPLILSDIHFPFHDLNALILAVQHGKDNNVDSVYLNGDILDNESLSRFLKDPKTVSFSEEREIFWQFIQYLKDELNVPIVFKMGNHEERWETYLKRNAPELYNVSDFSLKNVLQLDDLGIDFVESRQKCYMGKLIVIHGHEFGESVFSPVNPARGLFLKAKSSVLAGHNHQTSEHHENNLKGDAMACYSTGALCQLNPNYRPFAATKWNHGFAIVTIDDDGFFHVDNCRIINGKVR